ncbi:MAG TPA: enoyl-[acyl-carrier-protein] reductase FabI [Actinobacteria bacterium]|nr:enoyl-[acyl-carrier-protein] reductase FabI [Actinomycetota bacterium]
MEETQPTVETNTTGIVAGKRLLITGVLTESSIAFSVARLAQEQGADIVLTSPPRTVSLTRRIAARLPKPVEVLALDVTDDADLDSLDQRVGEHLEQVDGILHAIGFAPASALGGGFMTAPWADVATAMHVSTYSLVSLTRALAPSLAPNASVVGLDFDASVAWPSYDWMGVAKAALESASRYLAKELGPQGIRVNLVSAGPLRTMAARSIEGFSEFENVWDQRAPLGWDINDAEPTARAALALLSDWFPATTGEIVHVDGGVHAVGV